ncbi:hypothetical protein D3C72_2274900 [compost metagenome]
MHIAYNLSPDFQSLEVWGQLYDYGVRSETRAKTVLPAAYYISLQYINQHSTFSMKALAEAAGVSTSDIVEVCKRLLTIGVLEIVSC